MANVRPALLPGSLWLEENGQRELISLFRAITFNTSSPVVLADDERIYDEANIEARKLPGHGRGPIIGQQRDRFTEPASQSQFSDRWQEFLVSGQTEAALAIPSWVQDYALYLLDSEGRVAAWYSGAERIYGYSSAEMLGKDSSSLWADLAGQAGKSLELERTAASGHLGREGFQNRKDGSQFWANVVTMALTDSAGQLHGFAAVARDFTACHERDEKLQRSLKQRYRELPESTVAGIVFEEFEGITEPNDVFLDLLGYTREEIAQGRLSWADLTPSEYASLDGSAHEEQLRFGACAPYEKELIRKDGTRIAVQLTTAILKLSPFRSISFVRDLSDRNRFEHLGENSLPADQDFREMVGSSTALKRVLGQVELVAPTDATVLILGETGTGKELVARAIHRLSPRSHLPMVTLNCAAIPTGLLESELFGYERGAFTGALTQKIGRFEMAHRGTLFLDEVGDIPLDLQPKLLRALQEKSFERLGGTRTIPIDVRLVAATNRNLSQMMGDKLFRSDLYYRLKVFPITVPPLRDRSEDIPILTRHFTRKYAAKMSRNIEKIPTETMAALTDWRWPGNVRELENFIERAVILSRGPNLRAPLSEIRQADASAGSATLEHIEREHIIRVFRESGGVVTITATRLGLHRTTLNAMMRKLGISRQDL